MSDEINDEVQSLIDDTAEQWETDPETVQFLLEHKLDIDLEAVSDEDAGRARELVGLDEDEYEQKHVDELVDILKQYGDGEAVEQFRQEQLAEPQESRGEDEESGGQVATVEESPDAEPDEIPEADEDAELRELVRNQQRQINQLSSQLSEVTSALQGGGGQQQSRQQQQSQQQGQGGMLGNMSKDEIDLLKMGFNYLQSNNSPGEYEQLLQEAHQNTLKQTMNQMTQQTRPSVGQRVGQVIDEQVANEIAENIEINIGGIEGSGSASKDDLDTSVDSDGSEED